MVKSARAQRVGQVAPTSTCWLRTSFPGYLSGVPRKAQEVDCTVILNKYDLICFSQPASAGITKTGASLWGACWKGRVPACGFPSCMFLVSQGERSSATHDLKAMWVSAALAWIDTLVYINNLTRAATWLHLPLSVLWTDSWQATATDAAASGNELQCDIGLFFKALRLQPWYSHWSPPGGELRLWKTFATT